MIRILRILLLAVLLGPTAGQVLQYAQDACVEGRRDCCDPLEQCDSGCTECACCAVTAFTLQSAASSGAVEAAPLPAAVAVAVSPPLAPPSDILHVPKSV